MIFIEVVLRSISFYLFFLHQVLQKDCPLSPLYSVNLNTTFYKGKKFY